MSLASVAKRLASGSASGPSLHFSGSGSGTGPILEGAPGSPRVFGLVGSASLCLLLAAAAPFPPPGDLVRPDRSYWAYVASESEDEVSLVRLSGHGLELAKVVPVGSFPAEIEGPHGITVEPGGDHWYVSMAHGFPFGAVHKYATGSDEWLGGVTVGMFPATMTASPTTGLLYVANFDLHGDPEPSTVSVIETATMTEVARVEAGIMPHGARLNRAGDRLYSVSMMQDELVEIDALRFEVARRLRLSVAAAEASGTSRVRPTWVTAPTTQGKIYVAGYGADVVFEVDLEQWRVARRFEDAGPGPYNLAVSERQDLLVATYKSGESVGFWRLSEGREVARVATSRRIPHGVAITGDGRFTFVTVEGAGAEPGSVEAYENGSFERVAALDVGKQAGGIALWRGPEAR